LLRLAREAGAADELAAFVDRTGAGGEDQAARRRDGGVGVIILLQVVGADEFHGHAEILVERPDLERLTDWPTLSLCQMAAVRARMRCRLQPEWRLPY
jgi:hypothetical protein